MMWLLVVCVELGLAACGIVCLCNNVSCPGLWPCVQRDAYTTALAHTHTLCKTASRVCSRRTPIHRAIAAAAGCDVKVTTNRTDAVKQHQQAAKHTQRGRAAARLARLPSVNTRKFILGCPCQQRSTHTPRAPLNEAPRQGMPSVTRLMQHISSLRGRRAPDY